MKNMRKRLLYLLAATALVLTMIAPGPIAQASQIGNRGASVFNDALADFGVELFRRAFAETFAETGGENTLVSPLSVILALTMTANGADGNTRSEMQDVLGQGLALESLTHLLRDYAKGLPSTEDSSLNIANSIWYDDDRVEVLEAFLATNREFFDAEILAADFGDPATVGLINAWVKEKTEEMIDKIIAEIPEEALMYLINAIAFDAEWLRKFDDNGVRERNFTAYDGKVQRTEFMSSMESFLIEMDDAVGFLKHYKGGHYSFAAILPDEGIDIADFIEGLTGESLIGALESAKSNRP
ncbi:MAG: hypothetical protein FWD35_01660 [Oscillospiraceae bacterium]|nr:hypothetical protein [Oscillospiraceae bacterium]